MYILENSGFRNIVKIYWNRYVMLFGISKTQTVKLFINHKNKLGRIIIKHNFNV